MHSDSKKCRSFLALLFTAGDAKRWALKQKKGSGFFQDCYLKR